jgi:hypothetical protein
MNPRLLFYRVTFSSYLSCYIILSSLRLLSTLFSQITLSFLFLELHKSHNSLFVKLQHFLHSFRFFFNLTKLSQKLFEKSSSCFTT